MSRKNTHNWLPLSAVSIGTDQTSDATSVQDSDNIGIILSWSGTSPVGVLEVQVSNDKVARPDDVINWEPLEFSSSISVSGNSGSHQININQVPFKWLRLFYDYTSGTGTLTASAVMKQVGG